MKGFICNKDDDDGHDVVRVDINFSTGWCHLMIG